MTRIGHTKTYPSAFMKNRKEKTLDVGQREQLSDIFQNLRMVSWMFRMDQNDLLKTMCRLVSVCPSIALTALSSLKEMGNSWKEAMYNIRFFPIDLMQHLIARSMGNFTEGKMTDLQTIEKRCSDRKRLPPTAIECNRRIVSPSYLFEEVVLKLLPAFQSYLDTDNQVVDPHKVLKLIAILEKLAHTSEIAHHKIAILILTAWEIGCIPKEGTILKHFLTFFIQSLGVYINAFIKETKPNSQGDPKLVEEETNKAVDKQAGARVPVMTKAGLKEHMASLRQMWCQEFSAGLAEDLLCEDRQRALRRFGREKGLKQYEIDNILNASSASLKEKGLALMDAWQHGRCGSIVRSGKELQQEHFEETLKALSRRGRNSHRDRETKAPFPPDGGP